MVRPCLTPGCKGYATHGSHCPAHTKQRKQWRNASRKAVAQQVRRVPYCQDCGTSDRLTGEHTNGRNGKPDDVTLTLCVSCNVKRQRALEHGKVRSQTPTETIAPLPVVGRFQNLQAR